MIKKLRCAVFAKPFFDTVVISRNAVNLVSDSRYFALSCLKRRLFPVLSEWEALEMGDEDSQVLSESALLRIVRYTHCVANNRFWDEFGGDDSSTPIELRLPEARAIVARCNRLLVRVNAKAVLVFQGYMLEDAILRALALRKGLKVVAMERTLRTDRYLWDSISGITVNKNEGAMWFWRYEDVIKQVSADRYVAEYLNQIKSLKQEEHSSPDRCFSWPEGRARVLFLGQVYTDSSLLYGLYGCQNPVDVIAGVLSSLKSHNATAVLKLHPKEHNGKNPVDYQRYEDLTYQKMQCRIPQLMEDNAHRLIIDHDNRYDTYDLIRECDVVVTVNSQAGLEAAIMGKPVIHGRSCFYGGCGFTYEFSRVSDLDSRLSEAIRVGALDKERARMFFYIFYEMFCISKDDPSIANLISEKL